MHWLRRLGFAAMLAVVWPEASAAVVPALGACCTAGACAEISEADCTGGGGVYQGDNVPCAGLMCPAPVPSVGSRGLVVLAIGLLGAATWLLVRRSRPATGV